MINYLIYFFICWIVIIIYAAVDDVFMNRDEYSLFEIFMGIVFFPLTFFLFITWRLVESVDFIFNKIKDTKIYNFIFKPRKKVDIFKKGKKDNEI